MRYVTRNAAYLTIYKSQRSLNVLFMSCRTTLVKFVKKQKIEKNKLRIKPGSEPGFEPGSELGSEPGSEPGFEPGSELGSEPGSEPGFEPGSELGFEPGFET